MAGPHGHESSPPHQRPGHGHGPPHSPPKHGHDGPPTPMHGHGDGHGPPPPKPGHGDGHGPPHPHSPPKPSDGGSVPAVDPSLEEPSGPYPEVVGLTPDQAKKIIQQKLPGAVVDVIVAGDIRPENSTVPNTVRLWLDPSGNVQIVEIPAFVAASA